MRGLLVDVLWFFVYLLLCCSVSDVVRFGEWRYCFRCFMMRALCVILLSLLICSAGLSAVVLIFTTSFGFVVQRILF